MTVIPAERAGMASGVSGTVRFTGIVIGFAALGVVLFSRISLAVATAPAVAWRGRAPRLHPQDRLGGSRRAGGCRPVRRRNQSSGGAELRPGLRSFAAFGGGADWDCPRSGPGASSALPIPDRSTGRRDASALLLLFHPAIDGQRYQRGRWRRTGDRRRTTRGRTGSRARAPRRARSRHRTAMRDPRSEPEPV